MNPFQTTLDYTKSTKGTHVYSDSKPNAPIPSVYIKRDAFEGEPPKSISITVEVKG